MCLSNLIKNGLVCIKQSLPRIRIRGTVLATSIVRLAVVIKIWIHEQKYSDHGQTVKKSARKRLRKPLLKKPTNNGLFSERPKVWDMVFSPKISKHV